MINQLVGFFNSWNLVINFICHVTIFLSMFYIAVHNRELPNWVVTPLWWLAVISGFIASTILIQWIIGPEHPMSYWTLGTVAEVISHLILAIIGFILFLKTCYLDLCNKRFRKK